MVTVGSREVTVTNEEYITKIMKIVVAIFVFITSAYSSPTDFYRAIINVDIYIKERKSFEEALNLTNKDLNLNLDKNAIKDIYAHCNSFCKMMCNGYITIPLFFLIILPLSFFRGFKK